MTELAPPPASAAGSPPPVNRSPRVARQATPRWLDGRVVGGVLLVLLAVVVGYTVVNGAQRTSGYLAVSDDLAPGHIVGGDDLEVVQARLSDTSARYLGAGQREEVMGKVVLRQLTGGELLPVDAVGRGPKSPQRVVSFPVAKARAAGGQLGRGDHVDVIATVPQPLPGISTVVAQDVVVLAVDAKGGGLSSGTDALVVTVGLRPDQVVGFTRATETAQLDVVKVVPDAQGAAGDLTASPSTAPSSAASASASPPASPSPAAPTPAAPVAPVAPTPAVPAAPAAPAAP